MRKNLIKNSNHIDRHIEIQGCDIEFIVTSVKVESSVTSVKLMLVDLVDGEQGEHGKISDAMLPLFSIQKT